MYKRRKKLFIGGLMDTVGQGVGYLGKNAPTIAGVALGAATGNPMLGYQLGRAAQKGFAPGSQDPAQMAQLYDMFSGETAAAVAPMAGGGRMYMKKNGGMVNIGRGGALVIGPKHEQGGVDIGPYELEGGETIVKGNKAISRNARGGESAFVFSDRLRVPGSSLTFAQTHKEFLRRGASEAEVAELADAQERMKGGRQASGKKMPDGGFTQEDFEDITKVSTAEKIADFVPGVASIAGSYLAPKPNLIGRTTVSRESLMPLSGMDTRVDIRPALAEAQAATRSVAGNRAASSADIQAAHARGLKNTASLITEKANREVDLRNRQKELQSSALGRITEQQASLDADRTTRNTSILNADQDARLAMRLQGVGSLAEGVRNAGQRGRDLAQTKLEAEAIKQKYGIEFNDPAGAGTDSTGADNTASGAASVSNVAPATLRKTPVKADITQPRAGLKTLPGAREDVADAEAFFNAQEKAESGGNANAVSPKGATGLMQVMPDTAMAPGFGIPNVFDLADELGVDYKGRTKEEAARLLKGPEDPNQPNVGKEMGRRYSSAMLREFGNDKVAALAAYNWGPAKAREWLAKGGKWNDLPRETQNYIRRIYEDLGQTDPRIKEAKRTPTLKYGRAANAPPSPLGFR